MKISYFFLICVILGNASINIFASDKHDNKSIITQSGYALDNESDTSSISQLSIDAQGDTSKKMRKPKSVRIKQACAINSFSLTLKQSAAIKKHDLKDLKIYTAHVIMKVRENRQVNFIEEDKMNLKKYRDDCRTIYRDALFTGNEKTLHAIKAQYNEQLTCQKLKMLKTLTSDKAKLNRIILESSRSNETWATSILRQIVGTEIQKKQKKIKFKMLIKKNLVDNRKNAYFKYNSFVNKVHQETPGLSDSDTYRNYKSCSIPYSSSSSSQSSHSSDAASSGRGAAAIDNHSDNSSKDS